MPRRRQSVAPATIDQVFADQIKAMQKRISILAQAKMSSLQVADVENFNDPVEGMVVIDWPTSRLCFYHDEQWICTPAFPEQEIKVFSDRSNNKVGDGQFRFSLSPTLSDMEIIAVYAANGTAGSGATVVQLSNQTRGIDILSTPITIPSGAYDSFESGTPVINTGGATPANRVSGGDRIWIDVDSVGSGSKGLHVYIVYSPIQLDNTV